MSEDRLQIQVVKYVSYAYPKAVFTHPANGGRRNKIEAAKLKRMGVSAGCPDLLFFNALGIYTGLALELKFGKNKPTDKQKDWLIKLISCGWKTSVCYSFDECVKEIDLYFNQKNK